MIHPNDTKRYLAIEKKAALKRLHLNYQFNVYTSEECDELERKIKAGDRKTIEHFTA